MIGPGAALGPRILQSRYEPKAASSGLAQDRLAEEDARCGSILLASRCQRAIRDFAVKHRIMPDEARILLLDTGVRL